MIETPSWRLERRALRGHWSEFPISPATFEGELQRAAEPRAPTSTTKSLVRWQGCWTWRVPQLAIGAAKTERLALYRASLTVTIEAMGRADDSLAELADALRLSRSSTWSARDVAVEVVLVDLLRRMGGGLRLVRPHVGEFLRTLPRGPC